jgi:hypothetical protein
MAAKTARRRLLLGASMVEVWEDPQIAFGWTDGHLEGYMDREAWVSLFNAVVLRAGVPQPSQGS